MEVSGGLASSGPPTFRGPTPSPATRRRHGKPGPRAALLDPAQCVRSGYCERPINGSACHDFCTYEAMKKTMALS